MTIKEKSRQGKTSPFRINTESAVAVTRHSYNLNNDYLTSVSVFQKDENGSIANATISKVDYTYCADHSLSIYKNKYWDLQIYLQQI